MTITEDMASTLVRIEAELVRARQRRRLNRKLKERAKRFEDEFQLLDTPDDAFGLRVTAVPVPDDLALQPLSRHPKRLVDKLEVPNVTVTRLVKDQGKPLNVIPPPRSDYAFSSSGWGAMLRAVRSDNHSVGSNNVMPHQYSYIELHRDGLVEFGFLNSLKLGTERSGQGYLMLFSDHAVGGMAKVLPWVASLRRFAGLPDTEYSVQAVICVKGKRTVLYPPGPERAFGVGFFAGRIKRGVTTLPELSFGQDADVAELLSTFEHDLVNAGGRDYGTDLYGEFNLPSTEGSQR